MLVPFAELIQIVCFFFFFFANIFPSSWFLPFAPLQIKKVQKTSDAASLSFMALNKHAIITYSWRVGLEEADGEEGWKGGWLTWIFVWVSHWCFKLYSHQREREKKKTLASKRSVALSGVFFKYFTCPTVLAFARLQSHGHLSSFCQNHS